MFRFRPSLVAYSCFLCTNRDLCWPSKSKVNIKVGNSFKKEVGYLNNKITCGSRDALTTSHLIKSLKLSNNKGYLASNTSLTNLVETDEISLLNLIVVVFPCGIYQINYILHTRMYLLLKSFLQKKVT